MSEEQVELLLDLEELHRASSAGLELLRKVYRLTRLFLTSRVLEFGEDAGNMGNEYDFDSGFDSPQPGFG